MAKNERVWLVVEEGHKDDTDNEFVGIYNSKKKARKAIHNQIGKRKGFECKYDIPGLYLFEQRKTHARLLASQHAVE